MAFTLLPGAFTQASQAAPLAAVPQQMGDAQPITIMTADGQLAYLMPVAAPEAYAGGAQGYIPMHGQMYHNAAFVPQYAIEPQHMMAGGMPMDFGPKQLIVNFLDSAVTNADLHAAFSSVGQLSAARVIYDKATGNSKCFGFVYFKSSLDAQIATERLNGCMLLSRRIKVSFANPQRPEADL